MKKKLNKIEVDAEMMRVLIDKALTPISIKEDPEIDDFLLWQSRFKLNHIKKFKRNVGKIFAGLSMFICGLIYSDVPSIWIKIFMLIIVWACFNFFLED